MNESSQGWWGDISRCRLYKYPAYEDHLKANISCVTSLFSLKTLTEKSVNDFFSCSVQSLSWSFSSIFPDISPNFSEGIPTPSFLSAMNYGDISLKLFQQLCSGLLHVLPTSELITNAMLYTEQELKVYRIKWRESLHLSEQWRWKETMKCFTFTISWYTVLH